MTILSVVRAVEKRQREADALTRLVSDAQSRAARLFAQIEMPAVLRVQEQMAAIGEPMWLALEQVERVFSNQRGGCTST